MNKYIYLVLAFIFIVLVVMGTGTDWIESGDIQEISHGNYQLQ